MTSNATTIRKLAMLAATALLAGTLVTGCGGGDKDKEAAKAAKRAKAEATAENGGAKPPAGPADKQARLADAVVDSKTSAPIDMKYDLPAKPEVGAPFEVELAFAPRLAADSLEFEVTDAVGLTIVGEKTGKFSPVEAGQTYTAKVLVQGDKPGLYYVGVLAKFSTQVQTESRAFAVPVVLGNLPAAQKPAPAKDATGQPVQSVPAQEPK